MLYLHNLKTYINRDAFRKLREEGPPEESKEAGGKQKNKAAKKGKKKRAVNSKFARGKTEEGCWNWRLYYG